LNRYVLILFVAVGTYFMRFLPLKWSGNSEKATGLNEFLDYSASALLAALFVTSLVEFPLRSLELAIRALAMLPVLFTYWRWKNLGLSVVLGIFAHLFLSSLV